MQSRSTVLEGEGNFNHLRVVEEERKRKETRCRGKRGSGEGRGRHLRGIAIFFKDSERTGLPCPGRRQVAPVSAEFYRRCAHLHPPIHPFVESNFHLRTVFIDCHPSTLDPQTLLKDFRNFLATFFSLILCRPQMEKILKRLARAIISSSLRLQYSSANRVIER